MTAETPLLKAAAAIGLGCAYAGSCREDVLELLTLAIVCFCACDALINMHGYQVV